MEFRIWGESETKNKIIWLKLSTWGGNIYLEVVNELGEDIPGGLLLEIRGDGTICRRRDVSEDLGFQLDKSGRVRDLND